MNFAEMKTQFKKVTKKWDSGLISEYEYTQETTQILNTVSEKYGDKGYLALVSPKKYGGLGKQIEKNESGGLISKIANRFRYPWFDDGTILGYGYHHSTLKFRKLEFVECYFGFSKSKYA